MNMRNLNREGGLSLVGMIVVCVVLVLGAVLGIKVMPDVIEYFSAIKSVKATAQDPASREASVAAIRSNYERRASIDRVEAVRGPDLDISKEGTEVVISFAYDKQVPLFGPVSLLIHFEGSSAQ